MTSSAAADLELMRASMLLESDPAAAARRAGAILASLPAHDGAQLLLATACRRLGASERALDAIGALAQAHPTSALIQYEWARMLAAADRHAAAKTAFESALGVDPALLEAWRELATLHLAMGDIAAADAAYAEFERMSPVPAVLVDAYIALDAGRLDVAEAVARQRLGHAREDVAALRVLAAVAAQRGDDASTEATLQKVLELAPCCAPAREQLIDLLLQREKNVQALAHIERLLAGVPGRANWLLLKAEALRMIGRHAEGLEVIRSLVACEPQSAAVRLAAGNLLRFTGDTTAAIGRYREALALRPGYGEAYWALANLKTLRFCDTDVDAMRGATASAKGIDATYLQFALGAALEERGEYAGAFEHYARGNARMRAGFDYAPRATTEFVRRFRAAFSREFFDARAGWGDKAVDPIFIVGLPRCGSTLLEQILASHPQIEGTRELSNIPIMARELAPRRDGGQAAYAANVAALRREDVVALGARYLVETRAHRRLGTPHFVDKMLSNFVSIPLIQLMFPRARIIDCRREPMAVGFSCFKQLFNRGMNFAYDLAELGAYIRDYADLMAHVDDVLPGRVYQVSYESLVTDTESEVREILAYCALDFEPACLRHFDNGRIAQTISSEQVRQPVYQDAVDHWRHFEPWLAEMRAALAHT